jgi:transcriptional regulator with XRE-family HTH domain
MAQPMLLTDHQAQGRVLAAARMLAGLEQQELASLADVSATTVSNVERAATESRSETVRKLMAALRSRGVTINFNQGTGLISAATTYSSSDD